MTEIPKRSGDLLGLQSAREQGDDLDLALGEPGRPLESRHPLAGRLEHRGDGVGVEPSGARLPAELLGGPLGRHWVAVRARLGHRVVDVGRGEQTSGKREFRSG